MRSTRWGLSHDVISMRPSQLARRVDSDSVWRRGSMISSRWGLPHDMVSFNAAISAFEKGGQ
eukprot:406080-Karenia_brevis.AAC.1